MGHPCAASVLLRLCNGNGEDGAGFPAMPSPVLLAGDLFCRNKGDGGGRGGGGGVGNIRGKPVVDDHAVMTAVMASMTTTATAATLTTTTTTR